MKKNTHIGIAELKKQVSDLTKVSSQLLLNIRELFWILIIYMILLFPYESGYLKTNDGMHEIYYEVSR